MKRPRSSAPAYVGRPPRPLRQIWSIALVNREPRRWAPRGYENTREEANARLAMLLAADFENLYDGGWIRQSWI